jgi:choline transport protein
LTLQKNRSPTAAGQYNWVSEFGPPKYQRFLSYATGWLCAIGYHTFLASICFMVGTIIQGLIIINNESYVAQAWHGTLLTIAVMAFAIIFNTVVAGKLPLTEGIAVIIHICGLFGVIVPLW